MDQKLSHKSCPWSKTVWSDVMGIARKICVWTKLCGFNLMDRGRRLNANIFTSIALQIAKCKVELTFVADSGRYDLGMRSRYDWISNIWPVFMWWWFALAIDQDKSQPSVTHWEYCWVLVPPPIVQNLVGGCATWLEVREHFYGETCNNVRIRLIWCSSPLNDRFIKTWLSPDWTWEE